MRFLISPKFLASTAIMGAALLFTPLIIDKASQSLGRAISFSSNVYAQGEQQKKVTRRLPGISEKVFKGLAKVTEFASPDTDKKPDAKPDMKRALKELKKLEKSCEECNGYEKSQVYNMFAFVAYSLEKYEDAIGYYKKVVAQSPNIPVGVELQSLMYVAQLSFQQELYDQSLKHLDMWMNLANETGNNVGAEIYQLQAIICYQGDKKKCAFDSMKKAVDMVEASGNIADETWYNLLRSLHIERESYKDATAILEKMLRHYPKKSYWAQLGSMYGLLERSKDQMSSMATANFMGAHTKEKDYVNLASLYLVDDAPYLATKVLENGLKAKVVTRSEKSLNLLADTYKASKETKSAIKVLEEVAKSSKSGNAYAEIAGLYLDLDQPAKAIKAGKKALKAGKFTKEADGLLHINMGMAYFDLKQYSNAIESFDKASKIKRHRKFAVSWKNYAENEKARYDGLKDSLASLGLDIDEVMKK